MNKLIALFAVVLGLTVPVGAQQWSYKKTLADITVSGTAASVFTAADVQAGAGHVQATRAECTLLTANIRVTADGTTPTTSVGQVLTPGNYIITGTDILLSLQAIRDDSTSATLTCVLYGQ